MEIILKPKLEVANSLIFVLKIGILIIFAISAFINIFTKIKGINLFTELSVVAIIYAFIYLWYVFEKSKQWAINPKGIKCKQFGMTSF